MKLRNFFKNLLPLFIVLALSTIYYLLFTGVVFAAEDAARIGIACGLYKYPWCGQETSTPGALVATFYRIALGLVGGAALGVLIYGAILWTLSEAVTSKEDAKKWITGAVWGLALLLGAYLILYTINPDLVNIGQTQSFLNELIKPVTITSDRPANLITVPKSVAVKPGICGGFECRVDSDLSIRLVTLENNLDSAGIYWRITEAWPPTRVHKDPCHSQGACIDGNFSGGQEATASNINTFAEKASKSGLRAVYEVNHIAAKNELIAAGVKEENIIVETSITSPHFSIYKK